MRRAPFSSALTFQVDDPPDLTKHLSFLREISCKFVDRFWTSDEPKALNHTDDFLRIKAITKTIPRIATPVSIAAIARGLEAYFPFSI